MQIANDDFETQFKASLYACGVRGGDRLLAGFSGGADSTALVLLLREAGCRVTAIHINHCLRGEEADADAAWCKAFCAARDIPSECHRIDVRSRRRPGESLEASARRCRLEFWEERSRGELPVALGHQADDAVEDLLLRLARGSNCSGLTGLRPVRQVAGVRIVRPLLKFRRARLEAYLADREVGEWRRDSSNSSLHFRRNAVRHQWLPLIRDTLGNDEALHKSLEALQADADFLEQAAMDAVPGGNRAQDFRNLHNALLPRVLRLWVERELGEAWVPTRSAIDRFAEELARPASGPRRIPMGGGIDLILQGDTVRVATGSETYELVWHWPDQPQLALPGRNTLLAARLLAPGCWSQEHLSGSGHDSAYFAADGFPGALCVTNWRAGDRIIPFGHASERKAKDLFSAAGIDRALRSDYPLVSGHGRVLWIAGVKRSAHLPVVDPARPVVLLERIACGRA